jgi:hypothetical protein
MVTETESHVHTLRFNKPHFPYTNLVESSSWQHLWLGCLNWPSKATLRMFEHRSFISYRYEDIFRLKISKFHSYFFLEYYFAALSLYAI